MNVSIVKALRHFYAKKCGNDELAPNRDKILAEHSFYTSANFIVGSNILTGLLLYLDATTVEIGLVNIIAAFCNLLQIFSPLLLERFKQRKKLLIISRIIHHFVNILLIGMIAVLPTSSQFRVILILGAQVILNAVSAFTIQGYSVWHIQSVPDDKRVNFFSANERAINVAAVLFSLLSSLIVDKFEVAGNEFWGLMAVRFVALLFAVLDIVLLCRIKEFPYEESKQRIDIKLIFTAPFKEKKYLISVAIIFLLNIAISSRGSYYTVYLLDNLNASYTFISILSALGVPSLIFLTPVWTRFIKRTSWLYATYWIIIIYGITFLLQGFVAADNLWLYSLAIVLERIIFPCYCILVANMMYYNLPEGNQTVFLTFCSTAGNIGILLGNYFATVFATASQTLVINLFGFSMISPQLMTCITGILTILVGVVIFVFYRSEEKNKLHTKTL